MTTFLGLLNYWVVIALMMTGLYIVIAASNYIKKIIGLNIFCLLYTSPSPRDRTRSRMPSSA